MFMKYFGIKEKILMILIVQDMYIGTNQVLIKPG